MSWWRRFVNDIGERIECNRPFAFGIVALSFGGYGAHKFMLGYKKEGLIMLSATITAVVLAAFGLGLQWDGLIHIAYFIYVSVHVVAIAEGLIYLTKKEWDFY